MCLLTRDELVWYLGLLVPTPNKIVKTSEATGNLRNICLSTLIIFSILDHSNFLIYSHFKFMFILASTLNRVKQMFQGFTVLPYLNNESRQVPSQEYFEFLINLQSRFSWEKYSNTQLLSHNHRVLVIDSQ
jgi:hypothetical protein